jgi:hypothetical protein
LAAATGAPITLQKPVACTVAQDCFIQQYKDQDPGPGHTDYRCGVASYDDHDGTDFRIRDTTARARGVAVVAAADGVVLNFRDGMDDFEPGRFDKAKVSGVECGNGMLIGHSGGWETQYCHMRKGSVTVKRGDPVKAGQLLGYVGQSGDAAFPHLHLSVRQNGKSVDPFAYGATKCGEAGTSLWRASDRAQLSYRGTEVIDVAFATSALRSEDIDRGGIVAPVASSPAIVAYGRAINLQKGDVAVIILTGPDGKEISSNASEPVDRSKAQYFSFAGKKLKTPAWPPGIYAGTYEIRRGGKVVATRSARLTIK